MKKIITTILLIVFLFAYLFFFLGIELNVWTSLDLDLHPRFVDTFNSIQAFAIIQLLLFIILFGFCIYQLFTKKQC